MRKALSSPPVKRVMREEARSWKVIAVIVVVYLIL